MRVFNACAFNLFYTERKGKISPVAEVLLVTSEIEYVSEPGISSLHKKSSPATLRFSADAASLREMAKVFKDYALSLDAAATAFPNLPKDRETA